MNSRPRWRLAWSDGRGAQHGAGRVTSASGGAARCPAGGRPEGPGCSVQPRPSPQAALRAGTSAASTRRDRPQSGRPCALRERKPAHLRLKWASNPFGRRRFASCECCNLSEVRLGEGQLVAALPVDRSGSDHKKARGSGCCGGRGGVSGGLSPPEHLLSASAHGGAPSAGDAISRAANGHEPRLAAKTRVRFLPSP